MRARARACVRACVCVHEREREMRFKNINAEEEKTDGRIQVTGGGVWGRQGVEESVGVGGEGGGVPVAPALGVQEAGSSSQRRRGRRAVVLLQRTVPR